MPSRTPAPECFCTVGLPGSASRITSPAIGAASSPPMLWPQLTNRLEIELHRTMAYHPQANGLVERLHHHLKSALMAHLTDPDSLPGEFVNAPHNTQQSPDELLPHLRAQLGSFAPPPLPRHGTQASYIPSELHSAEYVFIRRSPSTAPLEMPYEGPYKVIQHSGSIFTLDIGGRRELLTVDRLKSAYLDPNEPVVVAQPKKQDRPTIKDVGAGSGGSCVAACR
ncbi:uncharacterized protein [Narcine bancroftii]|uniref:uncharacterized protein n=1 Tax=Narcine bancroftii TaxID=1343680 RepID=UPI00383211E2